jgi:hypothetical protein
MPGECTRCGEYDLLSNLPYPLCYECAIKEVARLEKDLEKYKQIVDSQDEAGISLARQLKGMTDERDRLDGVCKRFRQIIIDAGLVDKITGDGF